MVKEPYNNFGLNYFRTWEFFRKFKEGFKVSFIKSLKDDEGRAKRTPTEILQTAKTFYDELYKKGQTNSWKQEYFLELVERKITVEHNTDLNRNITVAEVKKAIKDTKAGGSPGFDGISIDFYKRVCNIIAEPLTHVINTYFKNASVPYDTKLSAISLIFKKGERDDIRNYRPISLSNNDLKLLTKVMCERLKK